MKKQLLHLLLLMVWGQITAQPFQLAPPQTQSSRIIASPSTSISFDFRLEGANIRYTTDGTEPTENSTIYTQPLNYNGFETLKAKSFKAGFLPSEATIVELIGARSHPFDSIAVAPAPRKYPANGWKTLCDNQLGDENFQKNWLGFEAKAVELQLFFAKKHPITNISIGLLRQQPSWIFLPTAIEVYDKKGKMLLRQTLPNEATELPSDQKIVNIKMPTHRHKSLKIKLIPLTTLPEWHHGAGNSGWIFLDEVMAW
jgi:hypothetical protein